MPGDCFTIANMCVCVRVCVRVRVCQQCVNNKYNTCAWRMLTLNTISHILLILIEPSRWLEQPQCRTVLRDIPAPAPPLRRPARQHRESGSPRPDQHPGSRSHDQRTGSQPYYLGLHHLRQRCHGTPHHHGARLPAWAVVWWATSPPTSQGSW